MTYSRGFSREEIKELVYPIQINRWRINQDSTSREYSLIDESKPNHTIKIISSHQTDITNPFYATGFFLYPPANIRTIKFFWCFQGVKKEISGMKLLHINNNNRSRTSIFDSKI